LLDTGSVWKTSRPPRLGSSPSERPAGHGLRRGVDEHGDLITGYSAHLARVASIEWGICRPVTIQSIVPGLLFSSTSQRATGTTTPLSRVTRLTGGTTAGRPFGVRRGRLCRGEQHRRRFRIRGERGQAAHPDRGTRQKPPPVKLLARVRGPLARPTRYVRLGHGANDTAPAAARLPGQALGRSHW